LQLATFGKVSLNVWAHADTGILLSIDPKTIKNQDTEMLDEAYVCTEDFSSFLSY